jgi:FKBP12-rapamycin complex-associated protein
MLEAFVYDPLISWRLVDLSPGKSPDELSNNIDVPSDSLERPDSRQAGISTNESGVPIDLSGSRSNLMNDPISENPSEDGNHYRHNDGTVSMQQFGGNDDDLPYMPRGRRASVGSGREAGMSATRARSLQMYNNIQNWAANLDTDNRIASIAGERSEHVAAEGSMAKSRIERSMRQREMLSLLGGDDGAAHEEALNEKALKVIRRVQDKLTGTDFPDFDETFEPLDVSDQVQRLIIQATSSENLCQLFIGLCAFW